MLSVVLTAPLISYPSRPWHMPENLMTQLARKWPASETTVMDIVYTTHILLIHFITTRTFDIESLYHSTYFLTYPLQTVFYLLKPKNSFHIYLVLFTTFFATLE